MPAARPDATIKRTDLLPELTAILKDADGNVVDLTGATSAEFHMTPVGSSTPKVDATATIVDPPAGEVKYTWAGTDTDTAGDFYAEFEITFTGKTETFPNDGHLLLRIVEQLA
jgi:hypothetical protein